MTELPSGGLELFATCPQSKDPHSGTYRDRVAEVARWSERAGYRGILVYTDNQLVDPWLVAQLVIDATDQLCPLVAVQPIYMHPYTVAKIVASIGHVYGRRVYLNMVAGGFRNDLLSLGDDTPHDERYERAVEYALIEPEVRGTEIASENAQVQRGALRVNARDGTRHSHEIKSTIGHLRLLAQFEPLRFAGRRLRQLDHKLHPARAFVLRQLVPHEVLELFGQLR